MTKVTVFGEQESKAEKRPIEFVRVLGKDGYEDPILLPKEYENLCLLGSSYGLDLIMAWDDGLSNNDKGIYLGHWNDGVV